MEEMENKNVLSPWDMATSFVDLWDWNKLSWILLTIMLVFLVHAISTRVIRRKNASWKEFLLWIISIVGWGFIMYMVMWNMMKSEPTASITLLLLACVFSFIGFFIFFRMLKDPEKKEWVSRIISGVILAIIVFGVLIFMGSNKQELGLAGFMGGLLGSFFSLAWHNLYIMFYGEEGESNEIMSTDDEDDDWEPPSV